MKALLCGIALAAILATPAMTRDGWQDRPMVCNPDEQGDNLSKCQEWISRVLQPNLRASCCGVADAYIADSFEYDKDGNLVAVISENYPNVVVDDDESYSELPAHPKGTRIVIPKEQINEAYKHGGNPSGHGIVFIGTDGNVLCYFFPTLT